MQDKNSPVSLRVTAPARLHLGFLDLNGSLGRRYGSIGLAVDTPTTDILATPSKNFEALGAEQSRVLQILDRTTHALGLRNRYKIVVNSAIPAHAGLGSGTQLALSIGAALMKLEGLTLSPKQIGDLAGRGARSAIGMAAFESGGFIVDGGRGIDDCPPPVLFRTEFPDAWRVILVFDRKAQGAHGDREAQAFAALPPFPEAKAGELCRLVLMQLLPGLKDTDISAFGTALTRIQEIVGGHFASAQGGTPWTSPAVGRLVHRLAEGGATGIGQTSWGPTGFAFAPSEAAAASLYHSLRGEATAMGLEMTVARGRNTGASIERL